MIGHFVRALQMMMQENREWTPGQPFEPTFKAFIDQQNPELAEREPMLAIVQAFDASAAGKPARGPQPKSEYIALFKLFTDWYFMEKIQPGALKRQADPQQAEAS